MKSATCLSTQSWTQLHACRSTTLGEHHHRALGTCSAGACLSGEAARRPHVVDDVCIAHCLGNRAARLQKKGGLRQGLLKHPTCMHAPTDISHNMPIHYICHQILHLTAAQERPQERDAYLMGRQHACIHLSMRGLRTRVIAQVDDITCDVVRLALAQARCNLLCSLPRHVEQPHVGRGPAAGAQQDPCLPTWTSSSSSTTTTRELADGQVYSA
jgi:hypothetical protein